MPRTVRLLVTIDLDDDDHRPADEVRVDVERQLAGDLADVTLIAVTDDGIPSSPAPAVVERDARTAKALTEYLAAVMPAMMRSDTASRRTCHRSAPNAGSWRPPRTGCTSCSGPWWWSAAKATGSSTPTSSASPARTGNPSRNPGPLSGKGSSTSDDLNNAATHGCIIATAPTPGTGLVAPHRPEGSR